MSFLKFAYLVQRYGNFVLLKPPFQADTWLLWGAPFAALLTAALAVFVSLRNRKNMPPPAPLTDAERQRLAILLSEHTDLGRTK